MIDLNQKSILFTHTISTLRIQRTQKRRIFAAVLETKCEYEHFLNFKLKRY